MERNPTFLPKGALQEDVEQIEYFIREGKEEEPVRRLRAIRALMLGRSWRWILERQDISGEELVLWTRFWNVGSYEGLFLLHTLTGKDTIFPPQRKYLRDHGMDILLGDCKPRAVPLAISPAIYRTVKNEQWQELEDSIAKLNSAIGVRPCRR